MAGTPAPRWRHPMLSRRTLILSSYAFAAAWTASMVWWNSPMTTAGVVILTITGAIAGMLWYRAMCLVDEIMSAPEGIDFTPRVKGRQQEGWLEPWAR